ncbi:MAG: MBL fold metallo-hydrolase, partial [Candidatus Omnitrophica bacterium]|nr:MBL fold metallo-hydrolase [Candidatus Omnitrophota bacterium]
EKGFSLQVSWLNRWPSVPVFREPILQIEPFRYNNLMTKSVLFRMNGVCNAFMREYGCRDCPQCSEKKPRAHTSGSLIVRDGEEAHHLLFDCGMGVIDSLYEFEAPYVTHLFLSHNHLDHIAEIDFLMNTQPRTGGPAKPPVYCTEGTQREGPGGRFPWLDLDYRRVTDGIPIEIGLGISLRVTPFRVYHGPTASEPVNWVIEFEDPREHETRKLILAWDLLHLIPRYPLEDRDEHYRGPTTGYRNLSDAQASLLRGADALFIEGNTLTPQPQSGHTSIETLLRFHIPQIRAKENFIVHYSGHEDSEGPMSDADLQGWLDSHKREFGLVDWRIELARHGTLLNF